MQKLLTEYIDYIPILLFPSLVIGQISGKVFHESGPAV